MKERFRIILAIILAATLTLGIVGLLSGCSQSGSSTDITGKYTLSQVSINGTVVDSDSLSQIFTLDDYFINITDAKNLTIELGD